MYIKIQEKQININSAKAGPRPSCKRRMDVLGLFNTVQMTASIRYQGCGLGRDVSVSKRSRDILRRDV